MKFSVLDRDGQGLMTRNDFFSKLIEEPRHFFADAIFNLIGIFFLVSHIYVLVSEYIMRGHNFVMCVLISIVTEPSNEEVLTFGEFLEGVCLYCLFETQDVLRCE